MRKFGLLCVGPIHDFFTVVTKSVRVKYAVPEFITSGVIIILSIDNEDDNNDANIMFVKVGYLSIKCILMNVILLHKLRYRKGKSHIRSVRKGSAC